MNSLRGRLVAGILTSVTLLFGCGGVITYLKIKERLYTEFDRSLAQRVVSLTSMIEVDKGVLKIDWLDNDPNPPGHQAGLDYYSVWSKSNDLVLTASADLGGLPLTRRGGSRNEPVIGAVELPDHRPGRCASMEFQARIEPTSEVEKRVYEAAVKNGFPPPGRGPVVQIVIAKLDTVAPTLRAVRRSLLGLSLAGVLLAGFIVWWVVRRSLDPLDELTAQIGRLKETMSGQRIALRQPPAELQPVAAELNRLLERIEQALRRERTLTSNVAHELRTPIAGLLSILEVALSRERSASEYRESAGECFEIAKRMRWLVNNLLSIARIEGGDVPLHPQTVALAEVLREWWTPFAARADERGLRVVWTIAAEVRVETDPEFLRVAVSNLFDNAVSYAPTGGTLHIEADARGQIAVANDAGDLNAEAVEHVFDPFWRRSPSREEVGVHAGLGLSLCQKIAGLLGGTITARLEEPARRFVVRLALPGAS